MKRLIIPILGALPFSAMAQCDCNVDGVPCYQAYRKELGIEVGKDMPLSGNLQYQAYLSRLQTAYGKGCKGEIDFPRQDGKHGSTVNLIIDTRAGAPFHIAEKLTWSWGGVFYFIDLQAATEANYRSLTGQE